MPGTQLKFKYKFKSDYNPVYCNGAIGGVSPKGEIIANFYQERHPLPKSTIHDVDENGKLSQEKSFEPDDYQSSYIRFVECGLVLNKKSAKSIVKWLQSKIDQLESLEKNAPETNTEE